MHKLKVLRLCSRLKRRKKANVKGSMIEWLANDCRDEFLLSLEDFKGFQLLFHPERWLKDVHSYSNVSSSKDQI